MNPFGGKIDPSVETAMQTAITAFKDAGVTVKQVDPPFAADLPALWGTLMFTETEALLSEDVRTNGSTEMWRYYQEFAARFEIADATGLLRAMQRRVVCQRAWAEMFAQVDVLLMPTSLQQPFCNDQDFKEPDTLGDILAAQPPLLAINVLGLPSAALPTHLENGSPRGVQLVGPMHQDAFVLYIAERLEREIGNLGKTYTDRRKYDG